MKRIALIMLLMLSVQSINAQRYERPSIYYSKEETYEYLKDYVGLWQFKDTLERIVFKVELVTNDTGHRIILKGRYSILKDGVYITNEFNQSICKCFYINDLCVKRQKSDDVDSKGHVKEKDLIFLTFMNHKNEVFVQFLK